MQNSGFILCDSVGQMGQALRVEFNLNFFLGDQLVECAQHPGKLEFADLARHILLTLNVLLVFTIINFDPI